MSAQFEVLDGGFGNCIQDAGRFNLRAIGVPVSGAADRCLLACANSLVRNAHAAAGLEIPLAGPRLRIAAGTVRFALAGEISARVTRGNGSSSEIESWQSASLEAGDVIRVGPARALSYLAVSGGFLVEPQLGSRATYARAALGGVDGRALRAGDLIRCAAASGERLRELRAAAPFIHPDGPIRVIAGPQDDHFTADALRRFFSEPFTVTRETDRMGTRLAGPRLEHRAGFGADILSEGVTAGAVQVPANGQPIVLGPDCQTVGGYPKIATVISADLPRLAHLRPEQSIRFRQVAPAEARAAWQAQQLALARWQAAIASFSPPGQIDERALYCANLSSGVVDARGFQHTDEMQLPWEME